MRERRWSWLCRASLWSTLAPVLLGMGALGGGGPGALPLRDIHATLVDVDGNRVDVNHLTVGGEASLEGDLGRGRLKLALDQVSRVTIDAAGTDRDRLRAVLSLRDGEPVTLVLRSSTTFYGQTASGAYSIRARDLRSVDLRP
jgi:hypothetical protein